MPKHNKTKLTNKTEKSLQVTIHLKALAKKVRIHSQNSKEQKKNNNNPIKD